MKVRSRNRLMAARHHLRTKSTRQHSIQSGADPTAELQPDAGNRIPVPRATDGYLQFAHPGRHDRGSIAFADQRAGGALFGSYRSRDPRVYVHPLTPIYTCVYSLSAARAEVKKTPYFLEWNGVLGIHEWMLDFRL